MKVNLSSLRRLYVSVGELETSTTSCRGLVRLVLMVGTKPLCKNDVFSERRSGRCRARADCDAAAVLNRAEQHLPADNESRGGSQGGVRGRWRGGRRMSVQ